MTNFSGLSVALSSLQAQRKRLEIGGQNIANANTEGYTRQRVDLKPIGPVQYSTMHGKPRDVGDGVQVDKITRMMDEFALNRKRGHEASHAYWKEQNAVLNEIEVRFSEPTDKGLASTLNDYYASWADVANNVDQTAPRTALIEEGRKSAAAIRQSAADLELQWNQNHLKMESTINEINQATTDIAQLNKDIRFGKFLGQPVSELQDSRDELLTKLSNIAGVDIDHQPDGVVNVKIGGTDLVDGSTAYDVRLNPAGPADLRAAQGGNSIAIEVATDSPATTWAATANPVAQGRLGAALDAMNRILPDVMTDYDSVANTLRTSINTKQAAGFQLDGTTAGTDFFTGTNASDLQVSATLTEQQIAASSTVNEALNGDNANDISIMGDKPGEPVSLWQSMVGDLGVVTSAARGRVSTSETQLKDADAVLESRVGVDIDEEMANLLTTQRAYQAAARLMTAVDEALDLIINRTGRVGL